MRNLVYIFQDFYENTKIITYIERKKNVTPINIILISI